MDIQTDGQRDGRRDRLRRLQFALRMFKKSLGKKIYFSNYRFDNVYLESQLSHLRWIYGYQQHYFFLIEI